jgi:hypothetical protein
MPYYIDEKMDPPLLLMRMMQANFRYLAAAFGRVDATAATAAIQDLELASLQALAKLDDRSRRTLDPAAVDATMAMLRQEFADAIVAIKETVN